MRTNLGFPLLGASVVITLATGGAAQYLGADPFWAISVVLIGAPLGAFLAALLPARVWVALLTTATCLAAFAASNYGKSQFMASLAQDFRAEQIWYIGWIATAALAATSLGLGMRAVRN